MLAGAARDQLLRVAAELDVELGYRSASAALASAPGQEEAISERAFAGWLSEEDEQLVDAIRGGLIRVASAVSDGHRLASRPSAIHGALDGAELVMRGELVAGHGEQLPGLLPSFVFLVTLPVVGQDEALRLSGRTAELLDSGETARDGS